MIGNGFPGSNPAGGVDVFQQNNTFPPFQYFIVNEQKTDITLTSPVSFDDEVINVSSGHGFTAAAGEKIMIWENNRSLQSTVRSVATNAITISAPSVDEFTTNAVVVRGNALMNVNASVTPVTYNMKLRGYSIPIDVSYIVISLIHPLSGDDGKFGGIASLTNGMYFRKIGGLNYNLGSYRTNRDFKLNGAGINYIASAPAGSNGTDIVFDMKKTFGQVIRINLAYGDELLAIVRDNLSGLTEMELSIIGSYAL